jgi:hypothetical protein
LRRSSFSTPKKTNASKKVTIVEEQQDMRISSPELGLQGKPKSGKQTPLQMEGLSQGSGMTLDTTMKVWRISKLIPELNANEKSGMGSAYCEGMCKNPHAIKLVKMAAMDLQRRDPTEAK